MESLNNIPQAGNFGDIATKLNDNFNKLNLAVETAKSEYVANKGYFDTLASLQAAYPAPEAGDTAYVANALSSTGYYIYNVVNGVWTASTVEAPPVSVPINNYALHGYTSSPKTLKEVSDDANENIEKHYTGLGLENRFSKQDLIDYSALRLFKSLEFSGLEDFEDINKKVENISLIQLYISGTELIIVFNINGLNDGTYWNQNIITRADISGSPSEVYMEGHPLSNPYLSVNAELIFDYSTYDNITMKIQNAAILPDNRIFISDEYIRGRKLDSSTIPGIIHSINVNREAMVRLLPFTPESYMNEEMTFHFYDMEITNIKESLESISITRFQKKEDNSFQLIVNENKRKTPDLIGWEQSIVMNAVVPTDSNEVIFEGQRSLSPLFHFKIKFDSSKWRSDLNFNNQVVAENNALDVSPEYIEQLKKKNNPLTEFNTFVELAEEITEIGGIGNLGGLQYQRIDVGYTEKSFKRLFNYKIPKRDKFRMVDFASRIDFVSADKNIIDITEEGVVRGVDPINKKIIYFDTFDDLKNGVAPKILYDLSLMTTGFNGKLRYFWQLDNGNLLIQEMQTETTRGGLWLIDTLENTATKVFTYRNEYLNTIPYWSVDFNANIIYLSEYGGSPIESGIGTKGDATKLWKSEDYGETWTELYDFKNIVGVIPDQLHIHSIHYDKSWGRLWVTTGDNCNETTSSKLLLWSDDNGVTWSKLNLAFYWGDTNDPFSNAQGLSMYSTDNFLLMGGDDFQDCIYRVAKNTKDSTPEIERVYKYNPAYNDKITQYTSRWMRLSNGMIVVTLINGDSSPRRTRLMGTFDGLKWYELWSDSELIDYMAENLGTLTEIDGYLYLQYRGVAPGTVDTISVIYAKFKIPYNFI